MRELMFGPRRFGELRGGLPGVSANVLTQRLAGLEAAGILSHVMLPPPASVRAYALTPWGHECEPVIVALGRWAVRSPDHDPRRQLSAASIMLSFRTMFAADRAAGLDMRIGFRLGRERFVARLRDRRLRIRRGEREDVDLLFGGEPAILAAIVYGGRPIPDAMAAGELTLAGDAKLARRFVALFPLPARLPPRIGTLPSSHE